MASAANALAMQSTIVNFTQGDASGVSSYKLDRLRELRAIITTLRCEQEARDPLLHWAVERDYADGNQHD